MPSIVNFAKELAKSRGTYTMGCQSGLTLFMLSFDNAPRTPSGTATVQGGAAMRRPRAMRGRGAGLGRGPVRRANARHARWRPGRLPRDSGTPAGEASSPPSRLGSSSDVAGKTEKFSRRLLSSSFEPCSIETLSRAKSDLNMVKPAAGRDRSASTPWAGYVFLSCGRPVTPVAIRGCLSSSSLPPSFARGRRTTVFYSEGFGHAGPDLRRRHGVMT